MRTNNPKYNHWLKRRNIKLLRIRKRRKRKKGKRTLRIKQTNDLIKLTAPKIFSLISNPDETTSFLNSILFYINNKNNKIIDVDSSGIEVLTIDALMYFLAIIYNNKSKDNNVRIKGNIPNSIETRKTFVESGFLNYVNSNIEVPRTNENLQIHIGEKSDPHLAAQIIDFIVDKSNYTKNDLKYLYNTLVELTSNSNKHAYNDNNLLKSNWYCFIEHTQDNKFKFTFMDTGSGIPTTVKKKFKDRVIDLVNETDVRYLISALDGEDRSSTGLLYRGKGLPEIRKYCKDGLLQNAIILTNSAHLKILSSKYEGKEIKNKIKGTLYYWEISDEVSKC